MKHQRSILTLVAILATAALATEKNETAETAVTHPDARQAVRTQIVARLSSFPPFSRVRPPEPKAHFHQWVVADGEKRLPFEVTEVSIRGNKRTPVTGYVRLKDNLIFIFDAKTQKHIRSDHDPRFAPPRVKPSTETPTQPREVIGSIGAVQRRNLPLKSRKHPLAAFVSSAHGPRRHEAPLPVRHHRPPCFRWGGKAVAAMVAGNVEVLTTDDLRDMRRWSNQASRLNDPDFTVQPR